MITHFDNPTADYAQPTLLAEVDQDELNSTGLFAEVIVESIFQGAIVRKIDNSVIIEATRFQWNAILDHDYCGIKIGLLDDVYSDHTFLIVPVL